MDKTEYQKALNKLAEAAQEFLSDFNDWVNHDMTEQIDKLEDSLNALHQHRSSPK